MQHSSSTKTNQIYLFLICYKISQSTVKYKRQRFLRITLTLQRICSTPM